ncbi:MAG: AAA family ATPase [Actinomycetota bacterium]
MLCPSCGEQNSDGARFCQACGAPLAPAAPALEERKVVSVLFVDLVDFTARSDQADPEDVRATLRPYHSRVKAEIESFGGVVEKFIGDAVMAVFGAPVAHGDDAERAVRAGLEVLDAIQDLNRQEPGLDLAVRAAVNTGEAIVDARSRPDTAQGLAHGDVVNTASRLQTGAPPGSLVVGEETYRATRTVIEYRPLDPISAKGKRQALVAWEAVRALTAPAERAFSGAPMVGRDRELDLTRTMWERVCTERRPHLITVVGPPGIGKSRLTREFAALVEASGGRVVRGRSLPYGESSGYRAFAQLVKAVAGIFETDSPGDARAKLDASIGTLFGPDGEATEVADHIALLTGLSGEESVADRLPLFFSARRFVEELANVRPLLLVFEDIHWSDPSQLDLLESLASRSRDAPVLFLALARPDLLDTRPAWGAGLTAHTSIELHPLEPVHARALASRLLPALANVPDVEGQVVERAEGNPLFIEELAAALSERVTEAVVELPTNVKSTIAARLDGLPAGLRAALMDASVVGKVFWRGAVLAMRDGDADLDDVLDQLEGRDFIHRDSVSQVQGDRQYMFTHMLVREVAYATLPRAARRERHAAVAGFIERASGERVEEAAAILAYHWREAGDATKAVEYFVKAADHAGRGWAKGEAIKLLEQALDLVGDDRLRRTIALRRAESLVDLGDLTAAIPALDELLPELEGRERVRGLLARGRAAFWGMDAEASRRVSDEAYEAAGVLGEEDLLGPALALRSESASMVGRMEDAFALSAKALDAWVRGTHRILYAIHLDQVALDHYWTGSYEAAERIGREGVALGEEIRSVESVLRTGAILGLTLVGLGRHEEAMQEFEQLIARGRELELAPRWTARALNMSSAAYRDCYLLDEARRRNDEGAELGMRAGFTIARIQGGIDHLFADLMEGEVARAEARWPDLWEATQGTKGWHQWLMTGRLAEARAEIALAAGRMQDAAEAAEEAIRQARGVGRVKYEVAARLVLAGALRGEPGRAVAESRTALHGAKLLRHPPTLWRAWSGLADALAAAGDEAGAAEARAAAADTVRAFAASLTPKHAETLLAAEPVAAILGPASSTR